ncbi:MAG TPA: molecular chaperone DnaK [Thermoanaerobaculia bacterium]|nr:molecular chaperone DnaK [Thermoanaerobaculia bacterium]
MSHILGIDLGTTNSCVAVVDALAPRVLVNSEGSRTTPSIVGFTDGGDRLIGHIAKRQAITNPKNTVYAVKRLIGRKTQDPEVERSASMLPYSLATARNGDVEVLIGDRRYSPAEVSSFVLRELKQCAEAELGEEIVQAVVTVPAYFDDAQRQATRDAGKIAGLEVMRIINEPTAAALAYGMERPGESRTIAVYDLGGGTFDVSILELSEGIFEVRATAGDTVLGGEDFDVAIIDWLIAEFRQETGIDLGEDRMALQRLKEAAERAKCELSTAEEATINLPFISGDESGPRHLSRKLGRPQFEELVEELVARTEGPCRDALSQAGLTASAIDDVLLVGGQTRSPVVVERVRRIFGREPNADINPDEVVAMGAAIQGAVLAGDVKDVVLLDVTPLTLGIETQGSLSTQLIPRNSTVPTKATQVFTTVSDNQDAVEIHVLQGERELARENRSLGKFELVGIPPAPRGVPQIEVTFAIDSNGIVNVSARDVATDRSHSIEINPASGLTEEEIEQRVAEAEGAARADSERREVLQIKNRVEGMIYNSERVFEEFRRMLGEEDTKSIHESLLTARAALLQDDRALLETAIADLEQVSRRLSDVMLNRPQVGG